MAFRLLRFLNVFGVLKACLRVVRWKKTGMVTQEQTSPKKRTNNNSEATTSTTTPSDNPRQSGPGNGKLMPDVVDSESNRYRERVAKNKEARRFLKFIFSGKKSNDWKSIPVFDDEHEFWEDLEEYCLPHVIVDEQKTFETVRIDHVDQDGSGQMTDGPSNTRDAPSDSPWDNIQFGKFWDVLSPAWDRRCRHHRHRSLSNFYLSCRECKANAITGKFGKQSEPSRTGEAWVGLGTNSNEDPWLKDSW